MDKYTTTNQRVQMPLFRGKNIVSAVSDYKDSVRLAVRSNINIAAQVLAVDGVSLSNKDRVLLVGQDNKLQNGIYVWSSLTRKLTRANDADSSFELNSGVKVYVEEGNSLARSTWTLVSQGLIVPDVTPLDFAKESRISSTNISGTYGSATKALQITVDETGQINAISEIPIDVLPAQAGQSGNFLKTDGNTASWSTIDLNMLTNVNTTGAVSGNCLVYNSSTGLWEPGERISPTDAIDGGNF